MLADARPAALPAYVLLPLVLTHSPTSAVLAISPSPLALADTRPSGVFAILPLPQVPADACTSAVLAIAPSLRVLEAARTSAILASALVPQVPADARSFLESAALQLLMDLDDLTLDLLAFVDGKPAC